MVAIVQSMECVPIFKGVGGGFAAIEQNKICVPTIKWIKDTTVTYSWERCLLVNKLGIGIKHFK